MGLLPLGVALLVLVVDSAIEMALISSMVGYLHRSGANTYPFSTPDSLVYINAKPKNFLLNEGHTSNGAAGTALVLICFGGFITLWHQRRRKSRNAATPSRLFLTYTIFTILSLLLTTAALAYTFLLSNQTNGQSINEAVASQTQSDAYPLDKWTPANWTKALLALPLVRESDASYLRHWLRIMDGWKWNLIPMFLIGLVVAALSVEECLRQRRSARRNIGRGKLWVESTP